MVRRVPRSSCSWRSLHKPGPGWYGSTGTILLLGWLCAWPAGAQSSRPGIGAIPYADALGTGVTFRVWAPNATSVAVPGQFNNWVTTSNYLVKEVGTEYWSADLPLASAGHQYKFH